MNPLAQHLAYSPECTTTVDRIIKDMNKKGITFGGKPYGQGGMTQAELMDDVKKRTGIDYSKPGTGSVKSIQDSLAASGVKIGKPMTYDEMQDNVKKIYGGKMPATVSAQELKDKVWGANMEHCPACNAHLSATTTLNNNLKQAMRTLK